MEDHALSRGEELDRLNRKDLTESSSSTSTSKNSNDLAKTTDFSSRWRQVRACARCHKLKMRCSYDNPTYASCRRCFAAGVECSVVTEPKNSVNKKRSTRTRSNSSSASKGDPLPILQTAVKDVFDAIGNLQQKVSKQEKFNNNNNNKKMKLGKATIDFESSSNDEINDDGSTSGKTDINGLYHIATQLTELQQLIAHVIQSSQATSSGLTNIQNSASSINSMKEGPVKMIPKLPSIPYEFNIIKELIKLKILDEKDAQERFNYFLENMLAYWPTISFSPEYCDFYYLLENRPLVLLAAISVTGLNLPDFHDTLLYYLERNLAQRVYITGDLTVDLIYVCIILALWSSPPRKWGSFKHQMSLLLALNLSLCLDLGNEKIRNSNNVLISNSEERKAIRNFISVYVSCGSLGLSLPQFRCVSWTPSHENASDLLMMGDSNHNDKFLYYYSRIIAVGQEIAEYFSKSYKNDIEQEGKFVNSISSYETKLQDLISDSGLITQKSKERHLVLIIYFQLLITMYDFVICNTGSQLNNEVYSKFLESMIKASEKIIDSFVNLCDETSNFPTFFYYRPVHALVTLIRARILVRSTKLDLEINVQREYDRVREALISLSKKSLVAKKMSVILTRVEKWMKVSNNFNISGATTEMVTLLDELGKEKIVENLKQPDRFSFLKKEQLDHEFFQNSDLNVVNSTLPQAQQQHKQAVNSPIRRIIAGEPQSNEFNNNISNTEINLDDSILQEFFREMDNDLLSNIQFMNDSFQSTFPNIPALDTLYNYMDSVPLDSALYSTAMNDLNDNNSRMNSLTNSEVEDRANSNTSFDLSNLYSLEAGEQNSDS
ncbi:hypothetical protein PACTADRAFT_3430 [Pachysolen tannophilus NRRL Y-2460]|uniref:Zn(2)-C6 fungal-type domain-containing protein n=1 Tax=Pachysolen tannophilus NRRL Y-2460 TaxID=669874 RepID=A0A1E4TS39_PACTA|nr:hypothetical protein PACTADRAFT_3430 [Pachysolen tannophilus NRRL Y-2460]